MVDLKKVGGMRAPPVRDAAEKARERELIKSMVEARNTDREILRAVRIQNLSENISALKEEIARQRLEYISSPLIQGQIVALVNAGKTDEEIRFTILGASKPGDVSEGILMILGTRITLQKSGIGSETKGGMSTTPPKSQAPSAGQLGLSRFRNKPPSKG